MPVCPDGHTSATSDYCDVCGAKLGGAAPVVAAAPPATGGCPVCQTPRTGRFCEECGHDFTTGTGGTPGPGGPGPGPGGPGPGGPGPGLGGPGPGGPGPDPAGTTSWFAVVVADRAYFDMMVAEDPDAANLSFPPWCPDRRLPLSGTQIRIGRRSSSTGVVPEIDLADPPVDPGISHLHAVLLAGPNGDWQLVDPGSANGTMINNTPVEPNIAVALNVGDRIHLGAWTAITLERASS